MHICRFCTEWAEWDFELDFKDKGLKIFIPVCKTHLDGLISKPIPEILILAGMRKEQVNNVFLLQKTPRN